MEAVNSSSALVARSLDILKSIDLRYLEEDHLKNEEQKVADVIVLLEDALNRLASSM